MSPGSPLVVQPGTGGARAFMLRKNQSVPELASPAASTLASRARKRGSLVDSTSILRAQRFSQLESSSAHNSAASLSKWVSGERFQRHEEITREGASTMNVRQLMKLDDRVDIDAISMKNYQ